MIEDYGGLILSLSVAAIALVLIAIYMAGPGEEQ
jgi:Ca2+/H+ antiporter